MPLEIAVASGKGGVGKSTVSSTIALALSRAGRDVIAVDADADAPNLHLVLGVDRWEQEVPHSGARVARVVDDLCTGCGACARVCPYDAVRVLGDGRYWISPVLCEGCATCSLACPVRGAIVREEVVSGRIRVARTSYGFPLVSAALEPGRPNSGKLVTEEKDLARRMAREDSVIVLDSAAGIGCQVVSSLAGSHIAVLVTEPTPAGFANMRRAHALAKHFMMPAAVIINKFDLNPEVASEIESYARESGMEVLGRIPYDDTVPRSMIMRMPHVDAFPDSEAARALLSIGSRVVEIARDWKSWWFEHRPRKPEPYKPVIISPRRSRP